MDNRRITLEDLRIEDKPIPPSEIKLSEKRVVALLFFAFLIATTGIALSNPERIPGVEAPYQGNPESIEFLQKQMDTMRQYNLQYSSEARSMLLDWKFDCSTLGIEGLNGILTLTEVKDQIYQTPYLRNMIDFIYATMNWLIISRRFAGFFIGTTNEIITRILNNNMITSMIADPALASQFSIVMFLWVFGFYFVYYILKISANLTKPRPIQVQNVRVELPDGLTPQQLMDQLRTIAMNNDNLAQITLANGQNEMVINRGGGKRIRKGGGESNSIVIDMASFDIYGELFKPLMENSILNQIINVKGIMDVIQKEIINPLKQNQSLQMSKINLYSTHYVNPLGLNLTNMKEPVGVYGGAKRKTRKMKKPKRGMVKSKKTKKSKSKKQIKKTNKKNK